MNSLLKKIIITAGIIILLITIGLGVYNYLSVEPKIIDSFPENSSENIPIKDSDFYLKFNLPQKNIKGEDVIIVPKIKGSWLLSRDKKEIKFKPEESLMPFTDYIITLKLKNRLGKETTKRLIFKTEYIEFKDLPEDVLKKEMELTDACEDGRKPKEECPSDL